MTADSRALLAGKVGAPLACVVVKCDMSSVHGNPKVEKKTPKCGHMSTLTVRRCRARARGAARRALAFHRHASDFDNFYAETSLTFTIRRPRIGLNFKFKLRKSSWTSPPASPRQRWRFCLRTRLPRAAARFCTPSSTQKHSLYVCLLAHLIRLCRN